MESEKELDTLWRRVKTAATVLTYLKTRARTMAVPHLAQASCGIKQLEGVGLVDRMEFHYLVGQKIDQSGLVSDKDGAYVCDLLNSVRTVTNVMENLVKRVLIAESETATEKEKVNFSQEEIKKKETQLESMSLKLEEMERFALELTRQRAAENEQELSRVKRDFESLKSYVSSLISVRETLISSEKQFQTIEKLFERKASYDVLRPYYRDKLIAPP
ncbi:Epidermal growth factor receptor substrate 15-like protein [Bienertia sinuspersici]